MSDNWVVTARAAGMATDDLVSVIDIEDPSQHQERKAFHLSQSTLQLWWGARQRRRNTHYFLHVTIQRTNERKDWISNTQMRDTWLLGLALWRPMKTFHWNQQPSNPIKDSRKRIVAFFYLTQQQPHLFPVEPNWSRAFPAGLPIFSLPNSRQSNESVPSIQCDRHWWPNQEPHRCSRPRFVLLLPTPILRLPRVVSFSFLLKRIAESSTRLWPGLLSR